MEVNYTVPQIAGDPSRPVYVVMHYRETHDTPAPMEGGYNIARTGRWLNPYRSPPPPRNHHITT